MSPTPKFPFLAEDVAASRAEATMLHPTGPSSAIEHFVASEVVINVLGPQWWKDHMVGADRDQFFSPPGSSSVPEGYFIQHAAIGLANDLLVCQALAGFGEQLETLRTRSLPGVANELRVASLLHRSGHAVQFVTASGQKGSDYDLLVDGFLPVETKAKDDDLAYSDSTLASTLKKARGQLPPSGPGMIVLRIPDAWPLVASLSEVEAVIATVLASTGRVNAVVIIWEEWVPAVPHGMACLRRFRTVLAPEPRSPVPHLEQLINVIATPSSAPVTRVA